MPKHKESSVGIFIKDTLSFDKKPPKRMYIYELWKGYDDIRTKSGMKGITYKPFSNYIWVLKKLKLLKVSPAPRGQRFKPDISPLSESVPDEWSRSYVQLNYDDPNKRNEILEHPAWSNPFKYYRILIGSEKFFSTEEKKKEWQAHKLAEKWNKKHPLKKVTDNEALSQFTEINIILREESKTEEAKHPSHEESTLIRISNNLKDAIDRHKGTKSINGFLIDALMKAGMYP